METPICDYVRRYARSDALRLHMPGHKGQSFLGMEQLDITEIDGADSLYEAEGIILQSESNAAAVFGCPTYYSTEGSSQCIRAMLYLALLHAKQLGRRPLVAAARNVHKTFLSGAAMLDMDVMWLYAENTDSYLTGSLSAREVEAALQDSTEKPAAVYLTSPDYLGNLADIEGISEVCRRHGVLLLVDNAHGAYLKFLEKSRHPIDLGANICCDSAHKTLPVLTGGAYLHISPSAPAIFVQQARQALALFGSTSPSYLILQSLDGVNAYLMGYPKKLQNFLPKLQGLKEALAAGGYSLYSAEPLKITIEAKKYGYTGRELSRILKQDSNIVCEFADPDYVVLMVTPETGEEGLRRVKDALLAIPSKMPVTETPPALQKGERVMSIREAMLSPGEEISVSESAGRILAAATVGCPPAVPILVCGERINAHTIRSFEYYGQKTCVVVSEPLRLEE